MTNDATLGGRRMWFGWKGLWFGATLSSGEYFVVPFEPLGCPRRWMDQW